MKKILIILYLVIIAFTGFSQVKGGVHSKLAKYYKNQQWEDCAFKADRMILKPKYEKDAEVYLYLAASYNKIFLMCLEDTTLLYKVPDYVNAYTYALKYSVKSKKLDKKSGILFPKNDFLLEEIAISGIYYIDHYVSIGKFAKAASFMRKIQKTYNDDNLNFYLAVLSLKANDLATAKPILTEIFLKLDNESKRESKNTDFIMIDAFDMYVSHLLSQEPPLLDSANNVAQRAAKVFTNDELVKYLLNISNNTDAKINKPENVLKKAMLKQVQFSTSDSDDEDSNDSNDDN